MDNAFDSIGAKLSPFEDVQRRFSPDRPSLLGDLWQYCFIHTYFNTSQGYWQKVESQLARCNNETCPIEVAKNVKAMLPDIEQPQCDPAGPDLARSRGGPVNMNTIWYELDSIMATQCVYDNLSCRSLS